MAALTPRQFDVVLCLSQGLTYRQIAVALGITARTARAHAQAVAAKLPGTDSAQRRILRQLPKLLTTSH